MLMRSILPSSVRPGTLTFLLARYFSVILNGCRELAAVDISRISTIESPLAVASADGAGPIIRGSSWGGVTGAGALPFDCDVDDAVGSSPSAVAADTAVFWDDDCAAGGVSWPPPTGACCVESLLEAAAAALDSGTLSWAAGLSVKSSISSAPSSLGGSAPDGAVCGSSGCLSFDRDGEEVASVMSAVIVARMPFEIARMGECNGTGQATFSLLVQ